MNKLTEIKKPTHPANDDCCGGGACNPCVWDDYNEKMRHWRIAQAKLNSDIQEKQLNKKA